MNEYYSKLAGEEDALSSFGLAHGTPRPPPSWAQGWLEGARKNGTKNLTIPSMREKKAFDPITLGALGMGAKAVGGAVLPWLGKAAIGGAASHFGGNVLQKLLRKYQPQLAQRQMASGITHGLEGKQMHPVLQRMVSSGLGPEYLAPYQTGHAIAHQTGGMSPEQRAAFLRAGTNTLKETQHLSKAPILEAIPGAVDAAGSKKPGFWHRFMPTAKAGVKFEELPAWQRAIPTAVGAPIALLEPGLAGHVAINKIREQVAHSDTGRKFMADQLAEGARGKELPTWKRRGLEYAISPAATDPRNIGLAAHKEYQDAQKGVNKVLMDRGHGPVQLPGADDVVNYAEGVANRLKKPAPAPAPAPVPGPQQDPGTGGALTGALLAGGGLYALNNRSREEADR
jgi:hypothetical protein